MRKVLTAVLFLSAGIAIAQTCVVPAPSAAPKAVQVVVKLNPDGGNNGCTGHAVTTASGASPQEYAFGPAKCAVARQFGDQAVANDNGWNDGGSP